LIELTGSGYLPRGQNEVLKIETFLFHPPLGKETFHPNITFHPGDISSKKSFHPAAAHVFSGYQRIRIRLHSSRFTSLQDFNGYGFGRTLRGSHLFRISTDTDSDALFADFHQRRIASRIFIGDGLLRGFSSATDCFVDFHRRRVASRIFIGDILLREFSSQRIASRIFIGDGLLRGFSSATIASQIFIADRAPTLSTTTDIVSSTSLRRLFFFAAASRLMNPRRGSIVPVQEETRPSSVSATSSWQSSITENVDMDSTDDPDWLPECHPEPHNIPNSFQIALANRPKDTPLTLARRKMWDPPVVAASCHQPNERGRRHERTGNVPRRQTSFSSHDTRNCAECLRHATVPRYGGGREKDRSRQLARNDGKSRLDNSTTNKGGANIPNFGCGCTGTTPFGCGSGNSTGYGGGRFARDNVGGAPVCQCVHAARNTLRKPHPAHK